MNRNIKILDTTLRDGSYAINFSYTKDDTMNICANLENFGFEYIEIGHGVGLGASRAGYGQSSFTDSDYIRSAKNILKKSKLGVFCIPGIATIDDVKMAIEEGVDFIRIGVNVDKITGGEKFIKLIKDNGIMVSCNFMKSYAVTPLDFVRLVSCSEDQGVDLVYIVDSAGGMFPNDIERYFNTIRGSSDIPLGFHGHNNIDLALANTLIAVELGFDFVDSSLQGLGRGAGNVCSEVLVSVLEKRGYSHNIDFLSLLKNSYKCISEFCDNKYRGLDVICGYADFHSSYLGDIKKYSDKYHIHPYDLIIEMAKIDKVNLDINLVERIASQLEKGEVAEDVWGRSRYIGGEQNG